MTLHAHKKGWEKSLGITLLFAGCLFLSVGCGEKKGGDTTPPAPADTARVTVTQNPPGTADSLSGGGGAVEGGAWVILYSDASLTQEIGRVQANPDGSFPAIGLGDNQYGTIYIVVQDAAGNRSTPVSVSNDIAPPETQIVSGPAGATTQTSATFTFTSSEAGTFECNLDSGGWVSCPSPQVYGPLGEGLHVFSVRATDAVGNVDASPAAVTWTIDFTPPDTLITSFPPNFTNSTTATLTFSSTESGSFECNLDSGGWASCTSPQGYSSLAEGPHTFEVRATDLAGNVDASPASQGWTIDFTPPNTTITAGPPSYTTSTSATFTFSSTESSSFECNLDSGGWTSCTSPRSYSSLTEGPHTFEVRATDLAGNVDASPASQGWTIDFTPPNTTITAGPPSLTTSTSATFTFSSSEAGTFECNMDSGGWASCTSPRNYSGLAEGGHTFEVRATDPAGNVDASPASQSWTIDITPPDTQITTSPPSFTNSTTAAFTFSSPDGTATFECRLDAGGYAACGSPMTYTGLSDGAHTFSVRAKDPAGNVDASPASSSWTVDTTVDTQITSGPPVFTSSTSATFVFNCPEGGCSFECNLDGGGWASCSSGQSYSSLSEGPHTFSVRATDAVGNVDASPAVSAWTIELDSWLPTSTVSFPEPKAFHSAVWTGSEMIIWGGATPSGSYTNSGIRYNPSTDTWQAVSTSGAPTARAYHSGVWTGSVMAVWGGIGGGYPITGGRYNPSTDSWQATTTTGAPAGRYSHTTVWTGTEMIVWGGYSSTFLNTGGRYNPSADTWTTTTTSGAPTPRYNHTAVWTDAEMVVWGGYDGTSPNTGGRYNPSTDTWQATSTSGAPAGRYSHAAVWTGAEMVAWGGYTSTLTNTGGKYSPTTDTWVPTTTSGAPAARYYHTAIWSGAEMVVWGGYAAGYLNTGGKYNPSLDSWQATTIDNAPSGRWYHTAVWTTAEMIIWGGRDEAYLNTGGRYSPPTDSWQSTLATGNPTGRQDHTAVWTGTEMVVWGGRSGAILNTGGKYSPTTDSWTTTTTAGAPSGRAWHTAVWTGSQMILWGGTSVALTYTNTGSRYDPIADTWQATSTTGAPSVRDLHTAVWTGVEMVVWGGRSSGYLNTGGRYNPSTDSWQYTSLSNAPEVRYLHTAVWTGSEMIVWGGGNIVYLNSGGRYSPTTDTWTTITLTNAPAQRTRHTSVWTGSEMVVWGGLTGAGYTDTGGRYNPSTDTWQATATTGAPTGRYAHTAVWTGNKMVIWGGYGGTYVNTGGRYNPSTDTWLPTALTGAPAARGYHTAVWTGAGMVVWGGYNGATRLNTGGRYTTP